MKSQTQQVSKSSMSDAWARRVSDEVLHMTPDKQENIRKTENGGRNPLRGTSLMQELDEELTLKPAARFLKERIRR